MTPARRPAPVTQDDVRRHNTGRLLRLLHVQGPTSRADLTALTGLNRSTVMGLTRDLAQAGLVEESAPVGRGGAGRPSITVGPCSDAVYTYALDVAVEHLTAVRIGLGGVVLDRRELRQDGADFAVPRTLDRLVSLVADLQRAAPEAGCCVGVGVAVCGVVSADDGVVRFAPNLGWVDVPLRPLLADRLAGPCGPLAFTDIVLGNDADLGATAEHLRGAGTGCDDLVFVSGEVGIGGGVILAGHPVRGVGGYAGEIGHMSIDPRGHPCRCGRRGCWETEISDEAVLRLTGAPAGMTLGEVLAAHAAHERWVQAGMRRVGRSLGVGVANLVNIFNPELVVFAGVPGRVFAATEPVVRQALSAALIAPREQVSLAVAELGDDAVVVGAGELAFAGLLADPLGALEALGGGALRRTASVGS